MTIPPLPSRRPGPALALLLAVALASPLHPAGPSAPKDHSIFVGQEVTVGWKGKNHRVLGVDRNAVRIMLDHKETTLPLSVAKDLRVKQGVKLSNLSASVANLSSAEGTNNTLSSDGIAQMQDAMAVQSMMEFQRDKAVSDASAADTFRPVADPNAAQEAPPDTSQAVTMSKFADIDSKVSQLGKANSDKLADKLGTGASLDETGIVITFEVSAPADLKQCHAVVVVDYTLASDPGKTLHSIALQPLGDIGRSPQKVTSRFQRFPSGADLKEYRVSLFSRGQEIATNVSPRRAEVTRDEAVIFLTVDYLASHPGETLPPAPILMVPRSDFVTRLGSASLEQTIFARVGKDGRIIRLSADAAGSTALPTSLGPAVDQIAFVPALEKGKPVEGVAKLKLADLVASN